MKNKELTKKQVANFWKKFDTSKLKVKDSLIRTVALSSILLTGCATTTQSNIQLKIEAPLETMRDCEDLQRPKDFTFGSFVVANIEYKKMYEQCKNLNQAKKQFILDLNK